MLILLSPSKTLDETAPCPGEGLTQPRALKQSQALVDILRKYDEKKLMKLMGVSAKIAGLNVARFHSFTTPFTPKNARPALWTFKGDVYAGMQVAAYRDKEIAFAQTHLRMLSGLYGLLRPLDLMHPYRLEMGTGLKNPAGKDLYAFWKKDIAKLLNDDLATLPEKERVIVNLASQEYARAVDIKAVKAPIVTIHFKEDDGTKLRVIGLFAKRARGLMADYAIRQGITDITALKAFGEEGYRFVPELSGEQDFVFARKQPAKKK